MIVGDIYLHGFDFKPHEIHVTNYKTLSNTINTNVPPAILLESIDRPGIPHHYKVMDGRVELYFLKRAEAERCLDRLQENKNKQEMKLINRMEKFTR